jgi:hypothetical protein
MLTEEPVSDKLPYVASPPSLKNAFDRIRTAATPPRFTADFVNAVLLIKGGTGAAITPFMKRIGFVASDGSPTELYKRFRNPSGGGVALAEAIISSYKLLVAANEYFHRLPDKDLKNLILQVTGLEHDNRTAQAIFGTLKVLLPMADFNRAAEEIPVLATANRPQEARLEPPRMPQLAMQAPNALGLNLAYTINLNLPATTDQAVFNAIFKSLREHLLSDGQ